MPFGIALATSLAGATAMGTGAAFAVPAILGVVGFPTGGIAAGSAAASFMASYGGTVASGDQILLNYY